MLFKVYSHVTVTFKLNTVKVANTCMFVKLKIQLNTRTNQKQIQKSKTERRTNHFIQLLNKNSLTKLANPLKK